MTRELTLSSEAWNAISRHAEAEFPDECCGVIFFDGSNDHVQRLRNIQNQLNALDPQTYPRTAVIAYAIDPRELETAIDQAGRSSAKLKAFYHSHPDHDAYFSEEDKAFACPFGEPTFPTTAQIVISIYNRAVRVIRAFGWSEEERDFVELPIKHSPS
jgi:proteasome lid subunit RPN8/RPN11